MIRLIACGKIKDKWLKEGIQEYQKRIQPYDKIEIIEVLDEKVLESNHDKDNEIIKNIEGERILRQIKEDEYVILLDLHGKTWNSNKMALFMQDLYNHSKNKITFVIGGSLGVSKDLVNRANHLWCISEETFPHQLCRLIVLEQIYRCFKILKNEPYHK